MRASLLLLLLFFLPSHLQLFSADGQIKFGASREDLARFCKRGETNIAKPSFPFPNDTALQKGESELNEAAKEGEGSLLNLSFRQKIPTYVLSFFPSTMASPRLSFLC